MNESLARAAAALAALQAGYEGEPEHFNLISQIVLDGVPALLERLARSDELLGQSGMALQVANEMLAEFARRKAAGLALQPVPPFEFWMSHTLNEIGNVRSRLALDQIIEAATKRREALRSLAQAHDE